MTALRTALAGWPRTVEIALALWLLSAPSVLAEVVQPATLWHNRALACALALCATLSLVHARYHRANLVNLALGLWLVVHAFVSSAPSGQSLTAQNEVLVGLAVAMFAVIPTWAQRPPSGWTSPTLPHDGRAAP